MVKTLLSRHGLLLVFFLLMQLHSWAQCAAPTGLSIATITGTSAQLSFTPSTTAQSYTVSYFAPSTGQSGTVSPNPTGSPVALTGLTPSTAYTVTVISNCAGSQTAGASVTFTTSHPNDEPCTAQLLSISSNCGSSGTMATLNGATTTPANGYNQAGCAQAQQPKDIWFTFRTAASGATSTGATVTASGFLFAPGQVRVFSAASCTGPFTNLGCAVGTPGSTTVPSLAVGSLTPNTLYYVRVATADDFATQAGFSICVSAPPACGPPQNVTVGTVTAATAVVNLTPGPGNTGYTVQLSVQGSGSSTTQTFTTAPPLTLTGLLPSTTYTAVVRSDCDPTGVGTTLTFTTRAANDEPAGAVALLLSATCQPTGGTTAGATLTAANGYANPGCSGGSAGDVWYTVTTAASGAGSTGLTLTAASGAPTTVSQLRLFRATSASGPFTEVACASAAATSPFAVPPLTWAGLTPATTYYVAVSASSTAGGFTLCATPAAPCPAPISLAAGSVTSSSATLSWALPGDTGGTFTVEYGPRGFVPGTGATGATAVANLSGFSYAATGLTPGQDYDFYVSRTCGGTAGGSLRSGPVGFSTPFGANDDPCGALVLPLGTTCQPVTSTTAGATATTPNGYPVTSSCNSVGFAAPDVWFSFTTAATSGQPGSQAVLLTATGAPARWMDVFSATSCAGPFTRISCSGVSTNQTGSPAPPLLLRGLTPGTIYYVSVSSGTGNGPFTICATPAPPCDSPTNLAVTNPTGTGATLTFTPATGNTGYTLTLSPAGTGTNPVTITGSPYTLSGLTPNTAYTLTLQSTCTGGTGAVITTIFNSGATVPVNNFCAGAITVTCGQTVSGSTIGANLAGTPNQVSTCPTMPSATAQPNAPGVYYRFTGTGDVITLATCAAQTNYHAELFVYTGSCASFTCVASSIYDGACTLNPLFPKVNFPSQLGVDYYIYGAGEFSGGLNNVGNFVLSVTCTPPACPSPISATVSLVTATTARVSFVPATGSTASSYTVTATPTAGGLAVTATGAGSPLNLTGLAPNTPYTVSVRATCGSGQSPAATATFSTPLPTRNAALAATVGLYPNPAHHVVTLTLPAALVRLATEIRLFNALGQVVGTVRVVPAAGLDTETILDLAGLPAGVYSVRLRTSQVTLYKHLVIE